MLQDFTEIRILKIVFPLSVVILCIFHVIKWMKTIISTANVEQEEKVELMTGFKGLIYALDEERFLAASQRWYGLIADVEVSESIYIKLCVRQSVTLISSVSYITL